ncbi:MAG: hypothetical protein AAB262_09310, partial [Elusimicrobiota bacterium]
MSIAIRRNSDGFWWNSVGFPDATFRSYGVSSLIGGGSGNWTYGSALQAALTSGVSYYLTTQASDDALPANPEAFFSVRGSTFIYDISKPSTTITGVVHLSTVSALSAITGTTSDNPGNSDPTKISARTEKVQVTIQRMTDGLYFTDPGWGGLTWLAASTTAVTSTSGTWTRGSGLPAWAHDVTYWIVARSSDQAGNVQSAFTVGVDSKSVTFDLSVATATINNFVLDAGTSYYNVFTSSIVGTVADSPADVGSLQIALSSNSASDAATAWYDGTGFTASSVAASVFRTTTTYTDNAPGTPDPWSYTLPLAQPSGPMEHGKTYKVRLRSIDKAVPVNTREQDFTFIYDIVAPTATISRPLHASATNVLIVSSGSSTDAGGVFGVGVATVSISISKVGTANCYSGASFSVGCPNWIAVGGTVGSWSYGVNWDSGFSYIVSVRATDRIGNVQAVFVVGTSSNTFSYENVAPDSFVTSISSGALYRDLGASISGTAEDPGLLSNIGLVELQIRDFNVNNIEDGDDAYWSGSAWIASTYVVAGFAGGSSGTWSYASLPPFTNARKYRLSVRARDAGGNQEADEPGPIFKVDKTSPTASFASPANGSGFKVFPAIAGTASDGLSEFDAGIIYSTSVQISITRQDTMACWSLPPVWSVAPCANWLDQANFVGSSSGTWNFTAVPSGVNLTSGVRYVVVARAIDTARPF